MGNKSKKLLGLAVAATMLGATLSMTACGGGYYKNDLLDDYVSSPTTVATENGGFAVEKDGYVYFINGEEDFTAKNKFGDVVKGALMRISSKDLAEGNYDNVVTVVPSLFAAQDTKAGIFIYGDYVYYATPTKDKNTKGQVENSWIDFKCSRLDGKTSKGYYFRLEDNSTNYRFVEVDGVVYCLYQKSGNLISYNTETRKHTTLVEGGTYYFDTTDLTNPNVYYTMSVVYRADSATPTTANYNQLYCVNAAATAKVSSSTASYAVYEGEEKIREYDFNESYLKGQGVDLRDYTEYPYVNLGRLVLDGIGEDATEYTQFNNAAEESDARNLYGYTYTVSHTANNGVYFKRKALGGWDTTDRLYYVSNADATADGWKAIAGNAQVDAVSRDTTNASATALYTIDEKGEHSYIYVSGTSIIKAIPDENGVVSQPITLADERTSPTLWRTHGDYLYFYETGTNGYALSRVNYSGDYENYHGILVENDENKDYRPITLNYVDMNNGWYAPEIFVYNDGTTTTETLLYSNAQSFGSGATAYNYIYATKLGDVDYIESENDAYDAVMSTDEEIGYIQGFSGNEDLVKAMKYFFHTGHLGEASLFEAVREEYGTYQKEQYDIFVGKFTGETSELRLENSFIRQVGAMKEDDATAIEESWELYLRQPDDEETTGSGGISGLAIALIIAAGVVVLAAGILIPTIIVHKKKVAAKKEAEATINAYKRKRVDMTDNKSIDVYADDDAAETENEKTEE